MRLLSREVPDSFTLDLLGDAHIGSVGCHFGGLVRWMDSIQGRDDALWANLGDTCDAICTDDKRFVFNKDVALPIQQADDAVALFRPVASQCVAWLEGNHEFKLHRFGDYTRDLLCKPLRVPFGGYVCKVALRNQAGPVLKVFLWHGPIRGSVTSNAKDFQQRQANMKATVRRYLENKASDCAVMAFGHTHKLLVVEPAARLLMDDNGAAIQHRYLEAPLGSERYLEPDRRWYGNTGSYLRSQMLDQDSYAELAGYDPIELGHLRVTVQDRRLVSVDRVVAP